VPASSGRCRVWPSSDPSAEAVVSELARRTESASSRCCSHVGRPSPPLATYSGATGVSVQAARRTATCRYLLAGAGGPWVDRLTEKTDHDSPIWGVGLGSSPAHRSTDDTPVGCGSSASRRDAGSFYDRPAKLMAAAIDYASILTAVAARRWPIVVRPARRRRGSGRSWRGGRSISSSSQSWISRPGQWSGTKP
jgi:hypothetical protein